MRHESKLAIAGYVLLVVLVAWLTFNTQRLTEENKDTVCGTALAVFVVELGAIDVATLDERRQSALDAAISTFEETCDIQLTI